MAAAVAAAALLAACTESTSSTAPTNNLDIATLVSATTSANLTAGERALFSLPTTGGLPTIDPNACPFSVATQNFVCTPVTRSGLTFRTTYFLLDSTGQSLSTPTTTNLAALRTLIDVNGTATLPTGINGTAAINSHSDMTLSGLLTSSHMLSGATIEHDTLTTTIGSATTKSVVDAATTTSNVVLPSGPGQWPASGTVESDVTTSIIGASSSFSTTGHLLMTFNGTSIVTAVVTLGGHVSTCQIDLSGKISPACQ